MSGYTIGGSLAGAFLKYPSVGDARPEHIGMESEQKEWQQLLALQWAQQWDAEYYYARMCLGATPSQLMQELEHQSALVFPSIPLPEHYGQYRGYAIWIHHDLKENAKILPREGEIHISPKTAGLPVDAVVRKCDFLIGLMGGRK